MDGIVTAPGWSAKAWLSSSRSAWLVQVTRWQPERGGWIRGWLKAPDAGRPRTFATLEAALQAGAAFCEAPDPTCWWENPGHGV